MKKTLLFLTLFISILTLKAQELTANVNITPETCYNLSNAKVLLEASGGDGNYVYAIIATGDTATANSFTNNSLLENLSSGSYTAYVRDNNGDAGYNEYVTDVTLAPKNPINLSITTRDTIFCAGVDKAGLLVRASNGVAPYNFVISESTTSNVLEEFTGVDDNVTFDDLEVGAYDIDVTDTNGCTTTQNFIVEQNQLEVTAVLVTAPTCYNLSGGIMSLASTGGSGNIDYIYELVDSTTSSILFSQTSVDIFTGVPPGEYSISVRNGNCVAISNNILVPEPEDIEFTSVLIEAVSCDGNGATIGVNVSNRLPPYTYEIIEESTATVISIVDFSNNFTFTDLDAGLYTVSVTDVNGCESAMAMEIAEYEELDVTTIQTNTTCSDTEDGVITVNAIGGIGNYIYDLVSSDTGNILASQASSVFTDVPGGNYEVSVTSGNCVFLLNEVNVINPDELVSNVEVLPTGNEPSGSITVTATGGTVPYAYSLEGNFSDSNKFTGLDAGTYTVDVRDANGCITSNTLTISSVDIDNSVSIDENQGLVATFQDAISYQWINIDTGERIAGATNVSYIPTVDGNYQVEMVIEDIGIVVSGKGVNQNKSVINTQTVLSPIINFTSSVLSINDVIDNAFLVHPNPATNYINVPTSLINENYIIYDLLGKQVSSGDVTSETLQLRNIANGIYYLKIASYKTVKFIKK